MNPVTSLSINTDLSQVPKAAEEHCPKIQAIMESISNINKISKKRVYDPGVKESLSSKKRKIDLEVEPEQVKKERMEILSFLEKWSGIRSSNILLGRAEAYTRVVLFLFNPEADSLDFSSLNLKELPDIFKYGVINQKLKYLNVSGNQLESLPDGFSNLKALEGLGLSDNSLQYLPDDFDNLTRLKRLFINDNQLKTLPNGFSNLKDLEELGLANNSLQDLPDSFGDFKDLKRLNLSDNSLQSLPDDFGNLIRLKKLFLNDNQLKTLPNGFSNLKDLKELGLANNSLQNLPDKFGDLEALEELALSNNSLQSLPDDFGNLTRLKKLALNNTQLKTLPNGFINLKDLEELGLANNLLHYLPDTFSDLKSLKKLGLSDNSLHYLPDDFGNLTLLEGLFLNCNQLKTLPNRFSDLQALKELEISNNLLEDLPDDFGNLKHLNELFINHNQLKTLPNGLSDLQALKILGLSNNSLQDLPESFGDLQALKILGLSNNSLQNLPESFTELQALEILDLSENSLRYLPDSFGELKALKILSLEQNFLTALPQEIGNFRLLEELHLNNNLLVKIPFSFQELSHLTTLDLSSNSDLAELSIESMLRLSSVCDVDLRNTPALEEARGILHTARRFEDYQGPRLFFFMSEEDRPLREVLLEMYNLIDKKIFRLQNLLQTVDVEMLRLWLSRISATTDFASGGMLQKALVGKIIEFLEKAEVDNAFCEIFAKVIKKAVKTCGDRVSLSIIHIGIQFRLAQIDLSDVHTLANFLVRNVWVIDQLEKFAWTKVLLLRQSLPEDQIDEIEIYLGYLIQLKNELNLSIDIETMQFFKCSNITDHDLAQAKESIQTKLKDESKYEFLIQDHKWLAALSHQHKEQIDQIAEKRTTDYEKAPENFIEIQEDYESALIALTKLTLGV